jgi:hypothetical protein
MENIQISLRDCDCNTDRPQELILGFSIHFIIDEKDFDIGMLKGEKIKLDKLLKLIAHSK